MSNNIILIESPIHINCNHSRVFDFIANLQNDHLWRNEIKSTTLHGKLELGVKATEISYLSKKVPNQTHELICTEFSPHQSITFRSLPKAQFFIQTTRSIETISQQQCTLSYQLQFEKNIVTNALGFSIPNWLIYFIAIRDMKKYLKNLKNILEANN